MENKLKSDVNQIQIICDYLLKECEHDNHLSTRIMLENKTVDAMYEYIVQAVRKNYEAQIKNNSVMVKDDEVYSLAVHYFIEDDETLKKEVSFVPKQNKKSQEIKPRKEVKEKLKSDKVEEEQISIFDLGV